MADNASPDKRRDRSMLGLMVLLGVVASAVFDGQVFVPLLGLAFVFYGLPALDRHVLARTFDEPLQRYALLAAAACFGLGALERLSELL